MDKTVPELLVRCGDSTPRVSSLAQKTMKALIETTTVKTVNTLPGHLTKPFVGHTLPRQAQARAELVETIIEKWGISKSKDR